MENTVMPGDYSIGELIGHNNKPEWGPAKVLMRDGGDVLVYFRDFPAHVPEDRVKRFAVDSPFLCLLDEQSDPVLDNIPPFRDGKFERAKTSLTLDAARRRFLGFAPRGFADPAYWHHERIYKWAAHERFKAVLGPQSRQWISSGDADRLRAALIEVYWPADKPNYRLNLMSPQFEWPAYKDSLEADGPLLGYMEAALEFAEQAEPDESSFHRYAEAVAGLPTREGGIQLEKWTVLTWLPFIANPTHHIFLKPQMTQEFASILPFELQYRAHLNHTTYMRLQEMAQQLKRKISDSEVNPEARDLDMIDVHSFMWIVVEYGKQGVC
jgi:hypothetical protein